MYSGDIRNISSNLKTGINEFRVNAISMGDKDGSIRAGSHRIKSGVTITKQDIISLSFTPIMGGALSKTDKILNAIRIVKDIDKKYRYDVESILYAFANKFLEGKDLEKVKEEIKMTELGKSLIEEGKKEGIKEGKEEGKKEKAKEIARELLDILSIEMISKKTGLTIEEVEKLKEDKEK